MPISVDAVQAPKPARIVVHFNGEELNVTYDRNAITNAMVESLFQTPIRARLGLMLLEWDLLQNGQPWQPAPLSDPVWREKAEAQRLADALAHKALPEVNEALIAKVQTHELTADEQSTALATPITATERRAQYTDAWDEIFRLLPRDFLRAVDEGVLDDFLGKGWRR